jgi:hypothetical protein
LPYTTGLAAGVSVALVAAKAWRQPSFFSHAFTVAVLSAGLFMAVVVLHLYLRRRRGRIPPWLDPDGATSWVLALQVGVLLLTVPVVVLVTSVAADREQWTWPFLNKRWLVALYFVGVATIVAFPVAFQSWFSSRQMETSRSRTARPLRFRRFGPGRAAGAILLAWFFAGPPWHLDRHYRDIEYHEQVHLGPLQAIAKGYLPYLGPASTQYGPGSQMLLYGLMRESGRFDLAAFRTAWAAINFAALTVVALVASWWLAPAPAVAVVLLAVTYSPLSFYGTQPDGALSGFFGWANALRYLAPLVVVPTLLRACGRRWVVLLGMIWGLGAWIAQENLSSTGLSAGLLLLLLGLTRTVSVGAALRSARDLALGFCVVAVPVVLYYASHQAAGTFLENYLALPRAVSAGFQNTWWPPGDSAARTFYTLPFFLVVLIVAALWRLPAITLRASLDGHEALFTAFLCVQLICYPVALLRTDAAHLQNTAIALPFVLVLGMQHLPRLLGAAAARPRAMIRWAFAIVALAILPAGRLLKAREILLTPSARFTSRGPSAHIDARVPYARARPSDQPFESDGNMVSRRSWLDFAGDVRGIVGDRKTYVAGLPFMTSGALYFLADLTPAPVPLDGDTMILNERAHARVLEDMRAHPDLYEAFIGGSLANLDARTFLEGHPDAARIDRRLDGETVHILLARR